MNAPLVFSAKGVSKRYPDATLRRRKNLPFSLRNVDIDVAAGEVVAIIGRNGAGKSTLLKLAAGVSRASEGSITRTRRVAPLIEVGAGFHPDLTGRQNVALNGRLLGMTKAQLEESFDSIVEFAELSAHIDSLVKTYSSGMFMRLGFSVAVHTTPELLLVDEVLAVGDLPFQVKCLDRIREMRDGGAGILFVSHNLAAVQSLATRAVFLEGGVVKASGDTREVIAAYHQSLAIGRAGDQLGSETGAGAEHGVRLSGVRVVDSEGNGRELWDPGDTVTLFLELEALEDIDASVLGSTLHKEGAGMIGSWLGFDSPRIKPMTAGEKRTIEFRISLNVGQGSYVLDVGLGNDDLSVIHFERPVTHFAVGHRAGLSGLVDFAPVLVVE